MSYLDEGELRGMGFAALGLEVRISRRASSWSRGDDHSGEHTKNPAAATNYTGAINAGVRLARSVVVGAGVLGEGGAVVLRSLVNRNVDGVSIRSGIPARKIKDCSRPPLKIKRQLAAEGGAAPSLARLLYMSTRSFMNSLGAGRRFFAVARRLTVSFCAGPC